MLAAVVVRAEVDGFLIQVFEQLLRDFGHADFCIAHCGRVIAIHGAKVTLSIDEHVTQGKVLRHAHNRVIHRRITMRMVFADHVADDASGFFIWLVVIIGKLVHRVQHTAMHWFQAVPHIGQRPTNDHA